MWSLSMASGQCWRVALISAMLPRREHCLISTVLVREAEEQFQGMLLGFSNCSSYFTGQGTDVRVLPYAKCVHPLHCCACGNWGHYCCGWPWARTPLIICPLQTSTATWGPGWLLGFPSGGQRRCCIQQERSFVGRLKPWRNHSCMKSIAG